MDSFAAVDAELLLTGRADWIGPTRQRRLARLPLESVDREFPHFVGRVASSSGFTIPADDHPVFYGCFDWHSAVHSHWCLVRQLRLFDDHPDESAIVSGLEDRLTVENVAREVAYFEDHEAFEKPYGWGWLLRLAAELHLWNDDHADDWRRILEPLEARIVELVETEFLPQDRPFRVGTHGNSAFALGSVLDYARVVGNEHLETATRETARRFFEDDVDYPVEYEPLGWDFLSPALTEADLLRRVLDGDAFETWFDEFLPDVTRSPYDSLLEPVEVDTGGEGIALHLVGLNLSKAWCLAGIASTLDAHPYADTLERSAERHAKRGLDLAFTEDYAGAHWLSSFALFLLTRNEGPIAPA